MIRLHVHVNPTSMLREAFSEQLLREALGDAADLSIGGPAELDAALAEAEALFLVGRADLSDLERRAPHLRWVSNASAGVEWLLDLPACIALTNASGTHIPKAAEYTLTAVLMLNNFLPYLVTQQRERRWSQRSGGTVAGKTALILGMGALGGAAAAALARQGLRVVGNSQSGRAHPDVTVMTRGGAFRAYLPEADFLVITLPLTPATRGLVGQAELDALPAHAGVVNIGRGEILDVVALAAKLREGSLGGAVLDTVPVEPLPADDPLWDTPNLILTPHCGLYDPGEYAPRCLAAVRGNLDRFAAGAPLEQLVRRDLGY